MLFTDLAERVTFHSFMLCLDMILSFSRFFLQAAESVLVGHSIRVSFLFQVFDLLHKDFSLLLVGPHVCSESRPEVIPFSFHVSKSFVKLVVSCVSCFLVFVQMGSKFLDNVLLLPDQLLPLVQLLLEQPFQMGSLTLMQGGASM